MPYIEKDKMIITKAFGVTMDKKIHNDKYSLRQSILELMHDEPERVDYMFLSLMEIKVKIDDREITIGFINDKYKNLVMNNPTIIKQWEITGGKPFPVKTTVIAGISTAIKTHFKKKTNFGLNIKIQIL